jgi:hypothetical protein
VTRDQEHAHRIQSGANHYTVLDETENGSENDTSHNSTNNINNESQPYFASIPPIISSNIHTSPLIHC